MNFIQDSFDVLVLRNVVIRKASNISLGSAKCRCLGRKSNLGWEVTGFSYSAPRTHSISKGDPRVSLWRPRYGTKFFSRKGTEAVKYSYKKLRNQQSKWAPSPPSDLLQIVPRRDLHSYRELVWPFSLTGSLFQRLLTLDMDFSILNP